jgi:host factor-I protein
MAMVQLNTLTPLQKTFLDDLVKKTAPVAIYLKNGIKLKGTILGFDETCILLNHPSQQIIYREAVSTVAPLITFETL